jgi:hypothetical protein
VIRPSASAVERQLACPGSAHLPQAEYHSEYAEGARGGSRARRQRRRRPTASDQLEGGAAAAGRVRNKLPVAQCNEVLLHNLACVVHAIEQYGIDVSFPSIEAEAATS